MFIIFPRWEHLSSTLLANFIYKVVLSTTVTTFKVRFSAAAAAAESLQSCPTLCDPIDGSPPGSPVPGILQAGTLEWVAISFSNSRKWKVKVKSLSRVWPPATPRTTAFQAPPSMGFSRQEYWSGVPLPSPRFSAIRLLSYSWKLVPFYQTLPISIFFPDFFFKWFCR